MATILNAQSGVGLTQTADGSGIVKLQSDGKTTNALAWVNFNGTTSPGTIRSQYNVSSVTRNSTGVYTISFTTAISNYYCPSINGYQNNGGSNFYGYMFGDVLSPTALKIVTSNSAGTATDMLGVTLVIHGD